MEDLALLDYCPDPASEAFLSALQAQLKSPNTISDEDNSPDNSCEDAATLCKRNRKKDVFGRFKAGCAHKEFWQRRRGKRGYSYFECTKCGFAWRHPTLRVKTEKTKPAVEPQQSRQPVGPTPCMSVPSPVML
uniref:Uncharacterized protein n=1 Tax=Eutreptiella gymnastica TaxID=73025 RepID=A0A7S1N3U3_9EUGL